MTRISMPFAVLAATLTLVPPVHAAGSLTRTFVSSAGNDTNPCTITAPCATFAVAYAAVQANGIIAALDPGKYGPLNITTGVTINGNGWSAVTAPAGGSAITINASGSDNVALIGLEIDGAGAAHNGITLNSAGTITVTNCTLQNFIQVNNNKQTGNGILLQPTGGNLIFTIANSTMSNNSNSGIFYFAPSGAPNSTGLIDRVVVTAPGLDSNGILIETSSASGGFTTVAITNTLLNGESSATGIDVDNFNAPSATISLSIDNVTASGLGTGIFANGTPNVQLSRSTISGNSTGVSNETSPNTFYSFQDNRINLNGFNNEFNIGGSSLITVSKL